MRELINKPWNYKLYEDADEFILSVTCGSVALFEINLKLSDDEKKGYTEQGENYIDKLAKDIQFSPSKFSERNIENFSN